MQRLLLVRHGETAWNAESRWQGWADVPLSAVGEAQAKSAVAGLLRSLPSGLTARLVASSDLTRAMQTARILSDGLSLGPVQLEVGLRERNVGQWAGLTAAEVEERWPGTMQQWRDRTIDAPPGGESDNEVRTRVMVSVMSLLETASSETCIVAVTHGGVIAMVEREFGTVTRGTRNLGARWVHRTPDGIALGDGLRLAGN